MKKPIHWVLRGRPLLAAVGVTLGAAALAGWFSKDSKAFYHSLSLPWFAPPSWVFAVVWPILYGMMALAIYQVAISGAKQGQKRLAYGLYLVQLVLNVLWTEIFFGLGWLEAAFWVLLLLLFVLAALIGVALPMSRLSAVLLLPYFIWCCFAALLNYAVAVG